MNRMIQMSQLSDPSTQPSNANKKIVKLSKTWEISRKMRAAIFQQNIINKSNHFECSSDCYANRSIKSRSRYNCR